MENLHVGLETETLAIFVILIIASLGIDMYAHRRDSKITLKQAIGWTLFWIAISMGFALFLTLHFNFEVASLFLAGYLFEQALSVDNLFVMMAIFAWFKVPDRFCHRVLYWGVLGAIFFRLIFVIIGSSLFAMGPYFEFLFALLVALSGVMMLKKKDEKDTDFSKNFAYKMVYRLYPIFPKIISHDFFITKEEALKHLDEEKANKLRLKKHIKYLATPLFLCLVIIETTDVMFAFDSVPAVIAVSKEPLIVYSAMIFAVLGLRSMYFVLDAMRKYLIHLEKSVIILLFFIAFKIAGEALYHITGYGLQISVYTSLAVIAVILSLGIIASFIFKKKETSE